MYLKFENRQSGFLIAKVLTLLGCFKYMCLGNVNLCLAHTAGIEVVNCQHVLPLVAHVTSEYKNGVVFSLCQLNLPWKINEDDD